jgi:hypothetical protein
MTKQIISVSNFTQQNTTAHDFNAAPILACYACNPNFGEYVYPEDGTKRITRSDSLSSLTAGPVDLAVTTGLSAGTYGLTTVGRLYYASDPTSAWRYIHSSANTSGGGLLQYNSYLYWCANNAIGRFDFNATYTDSWQALNGENPTYHPMCLAFGNLYIGDGRYVASWDDTAYNAQALDLPTGSIILWMTYLNDRLFIGTSSGHGGGMVYLWDGYSPSYNQVIPMRDAVPLGADSVKNNLFVICDNGDIRVFTGSNFETVKKLPMCLASSRISVSPHGVIAQGESLLFSINNLGIGTEYNYWLKGGVWEYNTRTGSLHLKYMHPTNYDAIGSNDLGRIDCLALNGTTLIFGGYSVVGGSSIYEFGCSDANTTHNSWILFNPIKQPEGFSKVFIKHIVSLVELLSASSSNKIILKYRDAREFTEVTPAVALVTSTASRLDRGTSLSVYGIGVGDEIIVLSGTNAGHTRHIASVDESGATKKYTLDEDFPVALDTTSLITAKPFKKIATITGTGSFTGSLQRFNKKAFVKKIKSPEVQFKIEIRGTAKLRGFSSIYQTKRGDR